MAVRPEDFGAVKLARPEDFGAVPIGQPTSQSSSQPAFNLEAAGQTVQDLLTGKYGRDLVMGGLRGASRIGTTLLRPIDALMGNQPRTPAIEEFFSQNANPQSLQFKVGDVGVQIAGTAGVSGAMARGVGLASKAIPAMSNIAPKIATALESGGMTLGQKGGNALGNMATRIGAGAVTGGAMAGLVDPEQAKTGAIIGGALPVAVKTAGLAGQGIRSALGGVSDEVSTLYQKAKNLGIDIPADRLINSRPLNAVASSLNYVPMSGRSATEEKMSNQMNRALSRTFGQDSENVTMALRRASQDLGNKFDDVLRNNKVKVDQQFTSDISANLDRAINELSPNDAAIIQKQADNIFSKAVNGEIDGQAAYNIKKTLDRIGNRQTNEAFYARELKKSLMGALNRSLGPDKAQAFAKVRQQYGNMLDLEGIAQNGAEGGISVGRLANLKNINNPELQDLADIAAQFLKARESQHGAMQRVALGGLATAGAGATGTLPLLAAGIGVGRATNEALNSELLRKFLMAQRYQAQPGLLANPIARAGLLNAANP